MRDSLMEYARTAVIPLHHGIGRYVRVALEFDARWIMISEVQFQSGMWRSDPTQASSERDRPMCRQRHLSNMV